MQNSNTMYPFSAIVGQEQMKKALLLNAINPRIGGVLIKGEKGTAKSTAARALACLLPEHRVVAGCPFGCDPENYPAMCPSCRERYPDLPAASVRPQVVELPISATEDMVAGSLDIGHAIRNGERAFAPGVLARANRNILYVDEVNLLNDHIVDLLLDAAAMGKNIIEREGISFAHPSAFILVGTMNPEEGELRPQLLDRFGLCTTVEGSRDAAARVEVIRRRQQYEEDPASFIREWETREKELRQRILRAKSLLPGIAASRETIVQIAQICIDAAVDGHRADITMLKTAAAIAAFSGRTAIHDEDISEAAGLVLPHRMHRQPDSGRPMESEERKEPKKNPQQEKARGEHPQPDPGQETGQEPQESPVPGGSATTVFSEGEPFGVNQRPLAAPRRIDSFRREGGGRRSVTESHDGRYVRSRIPRTPGPDIALDATIRAAAPRQKDRPGTLAIRIEPDDLREKVREQKTGNTVLFVVDASGSMGAEQRMTAVKGAILSLLIDAYQKRDRVGLVVFRGTGAEVLLPPTSSVELARKYLRQLPVGGKTPLAQGLLKALEVLRREAMISRHTIPRLILISDGRANAGRGAGSPFDEAKEVAAMIREAGIPSFVIDSETGFISFGLARKLSEDMGARYLRLDDLRADRIADIAKGMAARERA